jgi:hypothetical protein
MTDLSKITLAISVVTVVYLAVETVAGWALDSTCLEKCAPQRGVHVSAVGCLCNTGFETWTYRGG